MVIERVCTKRCGATAILTLDCGSAGVWLTPVLEAALQSALVAAEDDPGVRVVVLTAAAGPCALGRSEPGVGREAALTIANCSKPTIAAFPGDWLATGLELALACDLRGAAAGARLGLPQVLAGELPDAGGTQRLPRLIGPARALQLLLSGECADTAAAQAMGLITLAAPAVDPLAAALPLAERVAASAPVAVAYAKEAVLRGADLPLLHGLQMEAALNFLLQTPRDRAEGLAAFFARRPPRFAWE